MTGVTVGHGAVLQGLVLSGTSGSGHASRGTGRGGPPLLGMRKHAMSLSATPPPHGREHGPHAPTCTHTTKNPSQAQKAHV